MFQSMELCRSWIPTWQWWKYGNASCNPISKFSTKNYLGSAFFKRNGIYPRFWDSLNHSTLKDVPQLLKDAYKEVAPDSSNLYKMFEKDKKRMVEFEDWKEEDIHSIGDNDIVSPEHALKMFRLLPHAILSILPGIHGAYIGEATTGMEHSRIPDLAISIIEDFLN